MELTILYVLIFITLIGAFINPGISKSSVSHIASYRERRKQGHGNRPGRLFHVESGGVRTCVSPMSAADPIKELEMKEVEIIDVIAKAQLQRIEEDEETAKEGKLTSSYIVLGILLITFASNQWSRQALYYLCDFSSTSDPFKHINAAVNFNKEQYASLASFGFTIIFASVSLFAGSVSDKVDRNIVTALSCGVWSIATALQGFATGFQDLIPLRAIIGASQAFFNPAAYTLLAEIFPKKVIGSINGIFSSGVYLGGGLASLSIILDNMIGWRNTLFAIGGVGVVVAVLCLFLVTEPRAKTGSDVIPSSALPMITAPSPVTPLTLVTPLMSESDPKKQDAKDPFSFALLGLSEVIASSEAKYLLSASVLRFCAGFSIAIWKAPFVFAKFPENASSFAGSNAVIVAAGGLLSSLLGGVISDSLANPKAGDDGAAVKPRARAWVPAIGSFLAAPLWAAFILAEDPVVAAAALLGEYLTAECWFGPTLASLFNVVPKDRRGTAQGLFSVLTAAGNFAPVVVGAFAGGALGSYSLGNVLIAAVSGAYVMSGVLFVLAAIADDEKIAGDWEKNKGERVENSA